MKKLLTLGVALLIPVMILGQTSGKIAGTVTDEEGNPLPFILYSTDSLKLDIVANANVLIDSTLTNGGN